ncbi:anti-sigma factor [Granulicella sp. dw_53]|uniref:anti-sigma factor domain-containing protein n=1 Tax=Granulicella sp. dw_53 TaxID=2719792 RepID=UPI001BD60EF1|nr:anti-sigma factor [Granulicella sp. dw_53]
MNANKHFEQDDLALYAMQLLSAEEVAAITHHLEDCAECSRELAAVQGDLAIYAHTVDLHSPPALARERLLKQVAREKKIVPISRPAPAIPEPESPFRSEQPQRGDSGSSYFDEDELPRRSFVRRALPWVGWAVAAGLAVAAGRLYQEREALRTTVASEHGQLVRLTADAAEARQLLDTMNDATAMRVTLQKPKAPPVPQGRITYVADKGSLVFLASNMEPLLPYKIYELWLIPADGRDPIPAGTFHPDAKGNGSVLLPTLPKGVEAKAFGVTVEDEGGATTPTMPIIMAGTSS